MQTQARFNEGLALYRRGQLAQAQAIFQQILVLQPRHFDALYMLGMLAGQTGNSAQAVEWIDRAIEINPNYASAYSNRGNAFKDLKQHLAAIDSYDKAIAIRPDHVDAHYNRGIALYELKRHPAAIDSFNKAIAIRPDHADAHYNRGVALHELNQFQAAIDSYIRAIALKPDHAEAYYSRGMALNELRRYQAAIESYDQAIALKSDYVAAYDDRGIALSELKQYQAAVGSYDKAIAIDPDCAETYSNRAIALSQLRQYQAAIDSYDKAIAAKPDCAEAYSNRGITLSELKQHQAAIDSYEQALAIKPDFAEAHWNQGLCFLQMGDLERGWIKHEWRWKNEKIFPPESRREFKQALWLGTEPLQGRTILLHAEQGLGDTIQFCRYAKLVHRKGARVVLQVQHSLLALLTGLEGVTELLAMNEALPAFDLHCPLLSLPLAFKTSLATIPVADSYLTSDPGKVTKWRSKLGDPTRRRVGLVWSGNAAHRNDANRSIVLSDFLKFMPNHVEYVSLQKELRDADREALKSHAEILHCEDEIDDFTDSAALCELVDLVISVDTSVAHLAGALGKPVWILLPFNADWRWLLDRDDSPWYPCAKLYRQDFPGDWEHVFKRVAADLEQILASARRVGSA
jgi:tetratricopeptide (TPR) repeat protein